MPVVQAVKAESSSRPLAPIPIEPWCRSASASLFVPSNCDRAAEVAGMSMFVSCRGNQSPLSIRQRLHLGSKPAFAWLRGGDHPVPAGVRMFGGVLIRRTVAAQRYPTCLARSQMHPVVARFYALFAFETLRLFDGSDRVEMRTASGGHDSFTGLVFCLLTRCVVMPSSCGSRRRPFRLRRRRRHSV